MKGGFYSRMALDGIRKNRQLYLPYLMTCGLMAAVYYILYFLSRDPMVLSMRGGSSLSFTLGLGRFVIVVFSILFLFYTHSFLIRRRKKEFGLYNVLGMDKRNIARILLRETLWSYALSMGGGLSGGVALSKLAQLFLFRLVSVDINYRFIIEWKGVLSTLLYFALVFLLILLDTLRQIRFSNPIELVKSENLGEQPPKARWVLSAGGAVLLAAAYYLAVSIQQPLEALLWFFAAVLMVIVATYLLFIAGSVALCKLLQKNKRYYYKSAHFVSVSSMAFRMKRNGAGLASICILATMVLVMLSSTSCLYFGGERALRDSYPYDLTFSMGCRTAADCSSETLDWLAEKVHEAAQGGERGLIAYTQLEVSGSFKDGYLDVSGYSRYIDAMNAAAAELEHVRTVYLLPLGDYNRLTGQTLSLAPGEALICSSDKPYTEDSFTIEGCRTLSVRGTPAEMPFRVSSMEQFVTVMCVVVPDWQAYAAEIEAGVKSLNDDVVTVPIIQYCSFDLPGLGEEEQIRIGDELLYALCARDVGDAPFGCSVSSYAYNRSDFFGMYGSLFFIGIILSIVFIAAAALIIYYKQLSEGYEDQSRFGIMQKVGMTKENIRSAVNSQVLTVFFAPLLLAGLHLAFAFPFVNKIIRLFGVLNTPLLIVTSIVCFLAFALFYVLVYRGTAKAYYSIVSD